LTEQLFAADPYLQSFEAKVMRVDGEKVELDRTAFYAMGGGQPGDVGRLETTDGRAITIVDTRKSEEPGKIWHVAEAPVDTDVLGQSVRGEIDWERRHRLMRVHTLLHLLCAVVPDAAVTGGSIRDGSGRLDFDIPESNLDKVELTDALNELVKADHPVAPRWVSEAELDANPDLVRTMSVQPPRGQGQVRLLEIEGVDLQPCGGTHVARTGEIGEVRVRKIEKKGRQNRRINVELVSP
jgi:misacylated tRNA(Ala) deacylase